MDGRHLSSEFVNPPNPGSVSSRLIELLTSQKYWTVVEMADILKAKVATVHTAVNRLRMKHNVQTYSESNGKAAIKYYRIKP